MADEIYINIGSSFQQPYQGQTPTQAQSSEVKQIVKRTSVNSQTPYQSPSQAPTIYRNPVNAQTDVNAQESNPFTFGAQQQIEYQSPFRSPSITQVEAQQPSPYIVQVPFTYPFTYQQNVQTSVNNQTTIQGQQPSIVQTEVQQVGPVSVRSTVPYRFPYIYWYQGELYYKEPLDPEFTHYRGPRGDGNDWPGNAQGLGLTQQPSIAQGAFTQVSYQVPVVGQVTYRIPITYQFYGTPTTFQLAAQQPGAPYPAQAQVFVSQNPVRQPAPSRGQVNVQQPSIVQQPSTNPLSAQGNARSSGNAQQQITIQADQDVQNQVRQPARQPSPYIGQAQQQSPYIAQQPSTYQNPVNKQVNTQNDARQPSIYQVPYQVPYIHRSPYITQTPYSTTRTIGPIAKVKAIYLNSDGQNIEKIDQVYVNNSGTIEKIHQTVPAARFSKNPSNTQQ
jgi:hypothetical protein